MSLTRSDIAFGGILVLLPVCFLGQHRSSKRDQLGEQTLLRVDLIEKGGQNEHGPEVIKVFFMLNSIEHGIFPAYKCENANNCWHFNICEQEK